MCEHLIVKCLCCGLEGSPAQLMGSHKKTMTEKALLQRQEAGKKGGRPKGSKNMKKAD